jgi:dTDP-4-amino-4,6-dideoxygalactose transaminase
MQWSVPLAEFDYGLEEEQAVLSVLHSRQLSTGEITQAFEEEFAGHHAAGHAIAVSNAAQALHLACRALDIGPGDEVVVPAFSCMAATNAVMQTGAEVCFADIISPDEMTIDPADIEAKINPRTRAVIVLHYGGFPCRLPEILAIAGRHGIAVIEDASHAPGAWFGDRALGTWGEIGCFSFSSDKNITTREGGMILTHRPDLAKKLRLLRSNGNHTPINTLLADDSSSENRDKFGSDNLTDDMRSAIGRIQLGKLVAKNARRREITQEYWRAFEEEMDAGKLCGCLPISLPFKQRFSSVYRPYHPRAYQPAHHLFPILLPPGIDRMAFAKHMESAGVETGMHYRPVPDFLGCRSPWDGWREALPQTAAAAFREVSLPLFPAMTTIQVRAVVHAVQAAVSAAACA